MNCPHCKTEILIALEYDRVELDYCTECKGLWFDAGELELLFGDPDAARKFLSIGSPAQAPPGEKKRLCPECDATLDKEATASDPPVIFDNCPNGDGLWLDNGELETILTHAELIAEGAPVRTLLTEIFSPKPE